MSVPTFEPESFIVGESLSWTKTLDGYSAADGYALKYYFRAPGGTGFDVTATADGSGWAISVPASDTQGLAAGSIYWQAEVTKGSERHIVEEGTSTVRQRLGALTATTAFDGRTQAERDLEAVRAALAGNLDVAEYTIAGRTLKRRTKEDLIKLEHNLAMRVATERRAARLRDGAPFFQNVTVRFK
jgi:hypothetical protein